MYSLTLTAELEGVTSLQPTDTREEPYYYSFKLQCTSCREMHPNWVNFSRFDENDIPGSRGEANFVWKCGFCKKTHSASITLGPNAYNQEEGKKKSQKIIEMDCRGLEFTDFRADGDWEAVGVDSGSKFTGIDLTDGEWYDYDEKAGEEVSVKEIKWEIVRA